VLVSEVGVVMGKVVGLVVRRKVGKLEQAVNRGLDAEVVSTGDWELWARETVVK